MPYYVTSGGALYAADHQRKAAQKTPLILIHGAGSSHLAWPAALRRWEGRRVLALDLPGHGRSEGTSSATLADYSQAVQALGQALELEQGVVVGHSMGGGVALHLALQAPALVAGLVILGSGAHLPVNPALLEALRNGNRSVLPKLNRAAWAPDAHPALQALALQTLMDVPAKVLYDDYAACAKFDLRTALDQVRCPILVMTGSLDRMTPPALGRDLATRVPIAEYIEIEGGGHWMMLEQPEAVREAMAGWFLRHPR
ncbi:MAG: alpha/beta fold hydrolase [Anaerolineae bacterium]|nr:alpha/beta fold hydrolase [Anaerolineae bacterium]